MKFGSYGATSGGQIGYILTIHNQCKNDSSIHLCDISQACDWLRTKKAEKACEQHVLPIFKRVNDIFANNP